MALSVVLLLLGFAVSHTTAVDFYGGSMTFIPGPRHQDGTVEMSFHYRESSRASCDRRLHWLCEEGDCGQLIQSEALDTDQDHSGLALWCQSEGHMTRNVTADGPFTLSDSGCCWGSNVHAVNQWALHTLVDPGRRSDTHLPNRSPITATVPNIRIPQNCFSGLSLLAHDPDGDNVRCRFTAEARANCSACHQHPDITLDQDLCTLYENGTLGVGVHVFEMVLEDHPTDDITLAYRDGASSVKNAINVTTNPSPSPISQIPLQFALEILPPVSTCVPGVIRPRFLSPTPSHGDVHHAAVGHPHLMTLRAQSSHSIFDFQVSGPWNMTKVLKNVSAGVTEAMLSWTPQESDLHRQIPVCFTAETRESQSEMRCIVVDVAKSLALLGQAEVSCAENRISIVVSKASMESIDQSWLHLRDPSCSLTSNQSHIMGTVSLNSCGTEMEDTGDYIVFKNEINSFEVANSVITRRSNVRIDFSCQYPKVGSASSHYRNHKSDYLFTESSFGSFGYSFEIFDSSNFSSRVDPSLYPVEVKIMDMVYMGIEAHSNLRQVRLFVESCRATPDDNPYSDLYYDIIKNGCEMDETVKVYQSDSNKYDFEIQAFKFTGDYDEVYISCSVILCAEGNPNSRCAQGCLKEPSRRRRRESTPETARHYISQGPLRVARHPLRDAGSEEDGGSMSSDMHVSVSTVVFAGLFIGSILLLVGLMVYTKKSRSADRTHLLSTF